MSVTTVSGLVLAFVGLASAALLRGTVRLTARKADNGWDNAFAYVLCTGLLTVPAGWLLHTGHLLFVPLAPLLFWIGQTVALVLIYELRIFHAWLVGLAHAVVTAAALGALATIGGAIALYVIYGKIVADPIAVLRWLLSLLGVELPTL